MTAIFSARAVVIRQLRRTGFTAWSRLTTASVHGRANATRGLEQEIDNLPHKQAARRKTWEAEKDLHAAT